MKVIDLTSGLVYQSIAEAARAASVDPSNVRKVLKGQRQTAGGHMFMTAEDTVKPRDVRALQQWTQESLTETAKKRQQTTYRKHEAAVKQQRKAQQKKQTREQRTQQQSTKKAAFEAMRKANEYIRKQTAKNSGRASLVDLEALAQLVGQKKKKSKGDPALFSLSPRTLSGKTEQELQQIAGQIDKFIQDDLTRRRQYAQIRAKQYHITVEEAASEDMMDAIDNLTKVFERLRSWFPNPEGYRYSGRFKYREIYDDITVDAQSMTAEQIQRLADDLDAWMNEKRAKKEAELKDIYESWKKSVYKQDRQEDVNDEYKPIKIKWR